MTLVMKFGGAAVATVHHFSKIADIIVSRSMHYSHIVVVVSAMGNTTNELLELAKQVHPHPPKREQDMLISVGERVSCALLAMALSLKGKDAISFTGSQSGIITSQEHSDARILEVRPKRILEEFAKGRIVIVAGFQGMSVLGEITTLGRGGSDTTAVALAVAINAAKVEFFKDVPGIFTDDPKKNPKAQFLPFLKFEDALDIVQKGAKVLHARCVSLASKNNVPLHILPFDGYESARGSLISGSSSFKTEDQKYFE